MPLPPISLGEPGGASMGPSIFVDGDSRDLLDQRRYTLASMGPSSFVDGDGTDTADTACVDPLQWGRRASSTEIGGSMRRCISARRRLQWGRRSSSKEI